jgi:hypothetical protein
LRHRAIESAEEGRAAKQPERGVQDRERPKKTGDDAAAGADDEGCAAAIAPGDRAGRQRACGQVASEMSGESDAPTIEPVAKMTAELAPVSACAAARRITLERARASSMVSPLAVTLLIEFPPVLIRPRIRAGFAVGAQYEEMQAGDQPTQTGARYALSGPIWIARIPG